MPIALSDYFLLTYQLCSLLSLSSDNYFQTLDKRLQRNELVLKDELKLVLHLCQTPEDVEVAKNAIYR